MGKFVARYFPDTPLAANDIGVLALSSAGPFVDLVGIGDQDIMLLRRQNQYNIPRVRTMLDQKAVNLAIVYEIWGGLLLGEEWQPIAHWTIPENYICADEKVSFFARNGFSRPIFDALKEFQVELPPGVQVAYPFNPAADSVGLEP